MLEFWYDCLMTYCDKDQIKLLEMDTDSFYFSISGDDLEAIIKPNQLADYRKQVYDSCKDNFDPLYFPRQCCDEHKDFDKRTPGL